MGNEAGQYLQIAVALASGFGLAYSVSRIAIASVVRRVLSDIRKHGEEIEKLKIDQAVYVERLTNLVSKLEKDTNAAHSKLRELGR